MTTTEESSLVDDLADDANPAVLPEGAPRLTKYLQLKYRNRAEFMRKLETVRKAAPTPGKSGKVSVTPDKLADFYDMLADIDELMRLVAVDIAEFEAWQGKHDDGEFVELFNAYMRWSQAGEASSSAS